jgi:glycosyltransferase involved in cell wall biosynthesis
LTVTSHEAPPRRNRKTDPGVLFVTPWLRDGGIERVIQNTVPWLAERGYRCEVASWHVARRLSNQPNAVLAALESAHVRVRSVASYGRLRLIQRAAVVAAIALQGRHKLLIGYELEGNLVTLLARKLLLGRARVMAQIHNASGIHAEVGTSPTLLGLARRLYREADSIVAVSESIRLDSIRFFDLDPSDVVTIYNPLPIARIREMARDPLNDLALPSKPFIVGCGRLVRMKGFADLVDAFAELRREHDLQLVILGEGPERPGLIERARVQGVSEHVLMPGFVPNPWAYFGRASAFVLSSLFGESFSMVLVEAMACGAPVVASRCEWGPEEILENGRHGLLYDPGDVEQLTAQLRAVLVDPAAVAARVASATRRAEEFSQGVVLPGLERRIATLLA